MTASASRHLFDLVDLGRELISRPHPVGAEAKLKEAAIDIEAVRREQPSLAVHFLGAETLLQSLGHLVFFRSANDDLMSTAWEAVCAAQLAVVRRSAERAFLAEREVLL